MHQITRAALVLAAVGIAFAPHSAQAKGKYSCKPAITGWGSDGFVHQAKSKAIKSYRTKAAAAYGKVVWNNKIDDHCTKLQKGLGWQCWFKAQPCVDGGLKPSVQKMPLAKPPRLRGAPMPKPRGAAIPLRIAPKLRAKRMQRLR